MEQKTDDQATEHWADAAEAPAAPACRTSASPGQQQQRWSGAALSVEDGNKLAARQGLGTEGQQGRERQPGRGTGSLQGTQQTPDPEACPQQTLPLSIVPSNVAEMLQCGVRSG